MAKSPKEYLSSLTFDIEPVQQGKPELDAGERAFIEKYLGFDAFTPPAPQMPEPELLPVPEKSAPPPLLLKDPEIVVAPEKQISEQAAGTIDAQKSDIQIIVAEKEIAPQKEKFAAPQIVETTIETEQANKVVQKQKEQQEKIQETAATSVEIAKQDEKKEQIAASKPVETTIAKIAARPAPVSAEAALREKLRQVASVHVVSFYVSGQLFLLPVEGIREVVRHLELIKVPQAPAFIAGAINLRGSVLPLIKLSALLTNDPPAPYDDKNFIIIAGSEQLRIGLIIDKVNSMHMIPQKKIIWNAESKLGEAAEFLSAIVDLDDHVCGMISTDLITQKILPDLFANQQESFKD